MKMNSPEKDIETSTKQLTAKIFGVGRAGVILLEQIATRGLSGVSFAAINTDAASLVVSSATDKILLESKLLRGLGTGGDPERGRSLAEENLPKLKAACEGADVVFIVTGLGGGAGTGISPVLARAAKESGALVLAVVTTPFVCEGNRRQHQAAEGLAELKVAADGVLCLPNQKICKLIDEDTSVVDTFRMTAELLADGVSGIWRLMASKGLIEIHFADLCASLRDQHGESSFATAEASGKTRSREVLDKLFAHPMLDGGKIFADSETVLVSLMGGADLTMAEVNRVMEHINGKCGKAQVIMGAAIDEAFEDKLTVTIVATRRGDSLATQAGFDDASHSEARGGDLDTQLLPRTNAGRPNSRFVPPAPSMPQEKMNELMGRQAGTRQRKNSSKLRQGTLPLEIISKGRFDKSEPTIHKGEDLDVPTYIRRGVALN
jgi:cell division protein FtsZ